MMALTMMQKAALAGVGMAAVGLGAGYWVGKEARPGFGPVTGMGAMMREGDGAFGGSAPGMDGGFGRGRGSDGQGREDGSGSGARRAVGTPSGQGPGSEGLGRKADRGSCLADECLSVDGLEYPAGDLSDEAKSAVLSALDDEYKALAVYESIMEKFGRIRPFAMIAGAEEQHIAALRAVLDKYGVGIPANPWIGKVSAPDTVETACQSGYDAEVANAALYRETLLPKVREYRDITGVFTNLMNASQDRHLPAFERCK